MRRLSAIAALLCMAPAGLGFGPPALVESANARAPLYAEQVSAIQQSVPPKLSAASALMADGRGKFTLFSKQANSRRAMASVTKTMTALLAIESGGLDRVVRIRVDAAEMADSSVMGLKPGEEMSLDDLLYGLLLPSGNDAALAIAEAVAGTVPRFVEMMNNRAVELDLRNTRFANPHGLDAPDHYSNARDLVALARKAMADPQFAKIVATKERVVRGKLLTYQLRNTNRLLGEYRGVDGVKTGYSEEAGECLVATVQQGEERIFTAVLGSDDRFSDTKALLEYSASFDCRKLPPPNSPFDKLPGRAMSWGGAVAVESGLNKVVQLGEDVWDCRPAWQTRWRRVEVRWDDSRTDPKVRTGNAVYFVGDQEIGRVAVELR